MKNNMKLSLKVLRIVLIVALFGAWVGTLFIKREKHFPVEWLLHYVVGRGTDKKVPQEIIDEFRDKGFVDVVCDNYYNNRKISGRYALTHSTNYEGRGFNGRPQLFYLVGCFIFNYDHPTGKITGRDHYDWHESEDGRYYSSPVGSHKLLVKVCDLAGKVFGDDLFVTCRSKEEDLITMEAPGSCAAISNKLWWALKGVGAKEFDTIIDGNIKLSDSEISSIKRSHRFCGRYNTAIRAERKAPAIINLEEGYSMTSTIFDLDRGRIAIAIMEYEDEDSMNNDISSGRFEDWEYVSFLIFEKGEIRDISETENQILYEVFTEYESDFQEYLKNK